MSELEQRFTHLVGVYYSMLDYHKDKDCHWYIQKKWSYGDEPQYQVVHHGYVSANVFETFDTYPEALDFAVSAVEERVAEQIAHAQRILNDDSGWWGDEDVTHALDVVSLAEKEGLL